jgi:hypothetical protein
MILQVLRCDRQAGSIVTSNRSSTISWKKIDPSRYPVRLSIVHSKPVNSWKVASSFLKHPPTLTVVGKGDVLTEEPVEYASPDQPAEPPRLSWSDDKNEQHKQERGISFEQVAGSVLDLDVMI